MRGRPSSYDPEICKEICERVRNGEHIRTVLESKDYYPSVQSWYNWIATNKDLFELYHACRKDKAEAKETELLEIINDVRTGKLDPHAGKVLIDANKWLMSVYNPRQYGPKAEISGNGDEVGGISIHIHKASE